MMRLPPFVLLRPTTAEEAARMLASEGPSAALLAGGTDLLPDMKRRQRTPKTLVSVASIEGIRGRAWNEAGALRIGAGESLRALERDERLAAVHPGLHDAILSISTPILRTMGTIGGNVCLDTRCDYYDQDEPWRRAIDFCKKCEGETCWTAPGSDRCWAVNSSDSVPVLIALGARIHLVGSEGARDLPLADFFRDDGIDYLAKQSDEVLTAIEVPPPALARTVYRKVRRRGAFDFPVAAVAVRLSMQRDRVEAARIVLSGVASAPIVCGEAAALLVGRRPEDDLLREVAKRAVRRAKPLDNTDHAPAWRKRVLRVEVRRALERASRSAP
ncbi:MAG: xanthine dehydrogenase family protein subunit M [Planctomycetota bacterium]